MRIFKKLSRSLLSLLLATVIACGVFNGCCLAFAGTVSPASFTLNQKSSTVSRAAQKITGRLKVSNAQTKVTYQVYSGIDKGRLSFKGTADVHNGAFSIDSLKLKPHANKIVITATAADGKKEVQTVNLNYDSSSIKAAALKNIKETGSSGLMYVDNNLLVYFKENTGDEERQKVIDTVGGKCVGYVNGINMWQIEVSPMAYDDLAKAAGQLAKSEHVLCASCNMVAAASMADPVIPNDPWNGSDWSEFNPNNYNWSVEAVQAPSAWSYDWAFSHIDVGIVDAGVDDSHEDLAGKILFPDAASEAENDPTDTHGTHVAGIMGAIPNNNKGVTGILWDTDMYCVNWAILGGTDANLFAGLTETVEAGAKVVNFSLGLSSDISTLGEPDVNPKVISYAHQSEAVMTPLLNAGYDFIVCESAGNGHDGCSQDAIYNGYFCSVTENNLEGSTEMAQKINDRIIIVGSAERTGIGSFMQATTSNAGSQVDICAPGVSVYGCKAGDVYGSLSGTSMASPMVAAVAALTWSVNPALTGAEVRDLVLNNTCYNVADNPSENHPLVNTYRMVNAKLAVEAAIATKPAGSVTFKATPTNPTNGNVTVTITYPGGATGKEYKLGTGEWSEYTIPLELTANTTVCTRYTDSEGTAVEDGSFTVSNIDKTPPEAPVITPSTTEPTADGVTVAINFPTDAAVKEYSIDGGEWTDYTVPVELATNCTVSARCFDSAGNSSLTASLNISNIVCYVKIKSGGVLLGEAYSIQIPWYKFYKKIQLQLDAAYNTGSIKNVTVVWSSDNAKKVAVDQTGKITNLKTGARSANITVKIYDGEGTEVASDSVKLIFYKFKCELKRLS